MSAVSQASLEAELMETWMSWLRRSFIFFRLSGFTRSRINGNDDDGDRLYTFDTSGLSGFTRSRINGNLEGFVMAVESSVEPLRLHSKPN